MNIKIDATSRTNANITYPPANADGNEYNHSGQWYNVENIDKLIPKNSIAIIIGRLLSFFILLLILYRLENNLKVLYHF